MAFLSVFKNKKKKMGPPEEKPKAMPSVRAAGKPASVPAGAADKKEERFSHVIRRPRITEKASYQSGGNSYTFDVDPRANKIAVRNAVKEVYGVTPVKVHIINTKPKARFVRGRRGMTRSVKKALVFLKDGDTIEFV